jgi:hypothetical protein
MKYLPIKLFAIVSAVFILASCEDEIPTREPSPEVPAGNPAVSFAASNPTSLELEPGTPNVTILALRDLKQSSGALEVPIIVDANTERAFLVPVNIVFPAGKDTVEIAIGISPSAPAGVDLSIAISVNEQYTNPYKDTYNMYATGVWESAFFGQAWDQQLYKAGGQDVYRFYGPWEEGYDIRFQWDGKSKTIKPLNGTNATVGETPVVRYPTCVVDSRYGMVSFCIDPDPVYTYFDLENKVLVLSGAFTVAAEQLQAESSLQLFCFFITQCGQCNCPMSPT